MKEKIFSVKKKLYNKIQIPFFFFKKFNKSFDEKRDRP